MIAKSSSAISTSPLTWIHPTGTDSDRILFVAIEYSFSVAAPTVTTTVTYNGVSMTLVDYQSDASSFAGSALYYLVNPASGSNTVSVTTSVSSGTYTHSGMSITYVGASQTGVPDSSNKATGSSATVTASTTVVAAGCWLVSIISQGNATPQSYGAQTTLRVRGNIYGTLVDSNGTVSTGSQSEAITYSGSASYSYVIASFKPSTTIALDVDTSPRYWVGGTGTWDTSGDTTHWSASSGGTAGTSAPTSSTSAVYFDANSGGGTVTVGGSVSMGSLDTSGFTGTFTGSSGMSIYGSLTLGNSGTYSYTGAYTFAATATGKTITTNGNTIASTMTFNGSGGGWTLQDNLTSSSTITLTNGTLNLSSRTVTLTASGTPWTASGGTVTGGTSTIKYTDATSSSKTFAGGGKTYYNLWFTGSGTGAYTITGSNTFNDFKVDTPPHTVNFTAGTTQTVTSFTVNGTAGNLMTLQSTSAGTQWYLASASTITCDYLSLQDSRAIAI